MGALGSLRGYKDTFAPMLMIILTYWFVALPVGYFLTYFGIFGDPMGPSGIWIGMITGLTIFAGLIIIIFSLQLLGILNISFLNFEKKIYTKKNNNIWFSFVVGMAFGFGWTPCIGPILGSILALAATEETMFKAIILLPM